jgi:hypothetical protein
MIAVVIRRETSAATHADDVRRTHSVTGTPPFPSPPVVLLLTMTLTVTCNASLWAD